MANIREFVATNSLLTHKTTWGVAIRCGNNIVAVHRNNGYSNEVRFFDCTSNCLGKLVDPGNKFEHPVFSVTEYGEQNIQMVWADVLSRIKKPFVVAKQRAWNSPSICSPQDIEACLNLWEDENVKKAYALYQSCKPTEKDLSFFEVQEDQAEAVSFVEARSHQASTPGTGACIARAGSWSVLQVPVNRPISILATPVMYFSLAY